MVDPPRFSQDTVAPSRLEGLDLARALAVFGMVVVNFEVVLVAAGSGPGWLAELTGLLHGRAAATFVVLAGMGVSLLSRWARESAERAPLLRARGTLLRRALLLFVVGALYTPIWPADILHFYGLYLACAVLLLRAPSSRLWAFAIATTLAAPLLLVTLDYEAGWDWATLEYEGLWTPAGALRHLFFNGFHPVVPWLAFLLVGMALGRLELAATRVRRRLLLWGAASAAVAELGSRLFIAMFAEAVGDAEREGLEALLGTAPMPPALLFVVAGTGTACAVIGACLSAAGRWGRSRWMGPLLATGRLALTLYVAHVVVGMGSLEALGWLEGRSRAFALGAAIAFCVGAVLFSQLWSLRFERGPLEALLRKLSSPRSPEG